ncbi:MAG: hypothetical protein H0X51_07670 [Parachlamydiaceae bacterium]|nr:hypothetical protein [Parachlamydiaceae bacterium]
MKDKDQERCCIKETLSKKHAYYILITCDIPSDDGEMQVEMTYEGDASVAAYLLQGAQSVIAEHHDTCALLPRSAKIVEFS